MLPPSEIFIKRKLAFVISAISHPAIFATALTALSIGTLTIASCDDDLTRLEDCDEEAISSDLTRVFYWGDGGLLDYSPNHGQPVGSVRQPLWIDDSTILVLTETLVDGQQIKGVFAVTIEPVTLEFDSLHAYEFPPVRWSYDYDNSNEEIVITYSSSPGNSGIGVGRLSGDQLVIDTLAVGSSWNPSGVQIWPGRPGFVFYGTNPATSISGFYWHAAATDSLLFETGLTANESRSFRFNADGTSLYFGSAVGAVFGSSRVYKVDTSDFSIAAPIDERRGNFIALDVSPTDGRVATCRFLNDLPGSRFIVMGPDGGDAHAVDIRTHTSSCRFVLADGPCWDPSGRMLAFSGSAFTGEGVVYPPTLWVVSAEP